MQAIKVQYLGPTNCRGARLKASCERGSITIPYPYDLSHDDVPRAALNALLAKFCAEDQTRYGTPLEKNPWNRPWVGGEIDGVTYFVGSDGRRLVVECETDDDRWVITEATESAPSNPELLHFVLRRARA